jgi:hypothetical protein
VGVATILLVSSILAAVPVGFVISIVFSPTPSQSEVFGGSLDISFQTAFYSALFIILCFWAYVEIFTEIDRE